MSARYPSARWLPSPVKHPPRPDTWGIVIHWTAGHEKGDIAALTGGQVDVHFYVTKAGVVYQFLDADSQAWHAFHTANEHCVGIEHEGSGEAWTPKQLASSARLARWLADRYKVPVRHVDPPDSWHGFYGHRDLAGIDGNNHTDSVPPGTGWPRYLDAVRPVRPKPAPVTPARLAVLRAWIVAQHAAGKTWGQIKRSANWTEYRRGGGR